MAHINRQIALLMVALLASSCSAPPPVVLSTPTLPAAKIVRHPEPVDFSKYYLELTSIPKFNPDAGAGFQVDLRSRDLTKLDLTASSADLMYADFDSKTQWPPSDKMPGDFDWQKIMEIGKDPGLGIRALHDEGITGKGIGIAIIDQTLFVDHIEYKDRIRVYEEAEDIIGPWREAQMHGPAVASIAVGKTVGVAPEADLYFIATAICSQGTYETNDFACLANSIRRIMDINQGLPVGHKIRVLSISVGWGPESKGYTEVMAAIQDATAAGIYVLNVTSNQTKGLKIIGMGRDLLSDPNVFESYEPGLLWRQRFFSKGFPKDILWIPMDSRTVASPTGREDYAFLRVGGLSWTVPYAAGMYALAAQVKPDITPEEFWDLALQTGKTIHIAQNGTDYDFGVILDPQALIKALKAK